MGNGAPAAAIVASPTPQSVVKMPAAPGGLFASQPIEEQPASTLVEAVSLVARAVTAKIAYHQAQIDALRRALRPFHEMGKHGDVVSGAAGADDAVEQLLAIARNLDKGGV
jgi:hypothetical protein